jgi:hypothetical protein
MNRRHTWFLIVGTAFFCATPVARAAKPFDETLSLLGISFHVTSANPATGNLVAIQPSGLAIDNSQVVWPVEGTVVRAEAADINADGSPEIYVYTVEPGDDGRAALIAFSANNKKSLSQIAFPAFEDDPENAKGYRGHDEFAVLEGVVGRRFPIYPDDKTRPEPTGKMRQIQYKLVPGEAGWMLKIDRVVEF